MCTARQQGQRRSRRQCHANACVRRIRPVADREASQPVAARGHARTVRAGRDDSGACIIICGGVRASATLDRIRSRGFRSERARRHACTLSDPARCSHMRAARLDPSGRALPAPALLVCDSKIAQVDLQKDGTFREHVGTIIYIAPCVQCTLLTSNKCTSHMHFVKLTNFKLN